MLTIRLAFRPSLDQVISGLQGFNAYLAAGGADGFAPMLVREVAPVVLDELQRFAPVSPFIDPRRSPGTLLRSLRSEVDGTTITYKAVSYAAYVIGGTRPHVIEAVRSPVLMWYGADGSQHFARRVQHPGTQPNPFHQTAYEAAKPAIRLAFTRVADLVRRRFYDAARTGD